MMLKIGGRREGLEKRNEKPSFSDLYKGCKQLRHSAIRNTIQKWWKGMNSLLLKLSIWFYFHIYFHFLMRLLISVPIISTFFEKIQSLVKSILYRIESISIYFYKNIIEHSRLFSEKIFTLSSNFSGTVF